MFSAEWDDKYFFKWVVACDNMPASTYAIGTIVNRAFRELSLFCGPHPMFEPIAAVAFFFINMPNDLIFFFHS
ncbi:MAG TPA: hypothetical protein DEQ46_04915 [Cryomorphaceae bacterium]|nr:hypothetical protein [Cryomorphaceae bacterium]